MAEEQDAILALEAHVGNVLKTQGQLAGLLDRFPTQHLQVVCDPYNYLSSGLVPVHESATSELLDRFEPRFVLAHLKDVSPDGAQAGTPEFGTGAFAQVPYLEFLRTRRPGSRPHRRAHAARARPGRAPPGRRAHCRRSESRDASGVS